MDARVPNAVFATMGASIRTLQFSPFFRTFVCSFLTNVPTARLFLFTHPPETTALLKQHLRHPRIVIVPLEVGAAQSFQDARYSSYRAQLRRMGCCPRSPTTPARLALVDVADVMFQGDPFRYIRGDEGQLYLTEETRDYSLGRQSSNALWVRELYGNQTFDSLRHTPVLCSGFTMGHATAIDTYLTAMQAEVNWLHMQGIIARLKSQYGRDRSRGFDQGVHNVLARRGLASAANATLANPTAFLEVASHVRIHELRLLDGPVVHGNGVRAGRHFVFDGTMLWPRATQGRGAFAGQLGRAVPPLEPSAEPYAVVHQYGKMRPLYLQRRLRRTLSCRDVPTARKAPRHCTEVPMCRYETSWLGGDPGVWNRTASGE